MKTYILRSFLLSSVLLFITACGKDAGEGGTASVYGRVYVKDYNSTYTVLQEEYYAPKEDVYIIYGDDRTYSEHVETNYDGTFEFKFLRKGNYQVYVYSDDSTLQSGAKYPVIRAVEVTRNGADVEVPLMIIYK